MYWGLRGRLVDSASTFLYLHFMFLKCACGSLRPRGLFGWNPLPRRVELPLEWRRGTFYGVFFPGGEVGDSIGAR